MGLPFFLLSGLMMRDTISSEELHRRVRRDSLGTTRNKHQSAPVVTDDQLPDFGALLADPIIIGLDDPNIYSTKFSSQRGKSDMDGLSRSNVRLPTDPIVPNPLGSDQGFLKIVPGNNQVNLPNQKNTKHNIHAFHGTIPSPTELGVKNPHRHVPTSIPSDLGVVTLRGGDHIDLPKHHGSEHNVATIHKADGSRVLLHLNMTTSPDEAMTKFVQQDPSFVEEHRADVNKLPMQLDVRPASASYKEKADPSFIKIVPTEHIDRGINSPLLHITDLSKLHLPIDHMQSLNSMFTNPNQPESSFIKIIPGDYKNRNSKIPVLQHDTSQTVAILRGADSSPNSIHGLTDSSLPLDSAISKPMLVDPRDVSSHKPIHGLTDSIFDSDISKHVQADTGVVHIGSGDSSSHNQKHMRSGSKQPLNSAITKLMGVNVDPGFIPIAPLDNIHRTPEVPIHHETETKSLHMRPDFKSSVPRIHGNTKTGLAGMPLHILSNNNIDFPVYHIRHHKRKMRFNMKAPLDFHTSTQEDVQPQDIVHANGPLRINQHVDKTPIPHADRISQNQKSNMNDVKSAVQHSSQLSFPRNHFKGDQKRVFLKDKANKRKKVNKLKKRFQILKSKSSKKSVLKNNKRNPGQRRLLNLSKNIRKLQRRPTARRRIGRRRKGNRAPSFGKNGFKSKDGRNEGRRRTQ